MPANVNIQQIVREIVPAFSIHEIAHVIYKYIEELENPGTTMSPSQEIYNIFPQYFDRGNHMGNIDTDKEYLLLIMEMKKNAINNDFLWRHIAIPFQILSRLINDKHKKLRTKVRNALKKHTNEMNYITETTNPVSDKVQMLRVGRGRKKKSKKKKPKKIPKKSRKKKGSK